MKNRTDSKRFSEKLFSSDIRACRVMLVFLCSVGCFAFSNEDTSGAPYVQNGAVCYINKQWIEKSTPLFFGDLLEHIPFGYVAKLTYGGTLSDYKITGHELFMDDRPVSLVVNGATLRGASADRVYLNRLPVQGVDSAKVSSGLSLSGGEKEIYVYTKDDFRVDPVTRVLWESGPFGFGGVQFAFSRRLSRNSGLSLTVQKVYQADGDLLESTSIRKYSHPEAIVDIYRVLLGRNNDKYVSEGLVLENNFSLWNVNFNIVPKEVINLCLGYEYLDDKQVDARYSNSGSLINTSSAKSSNRLSLRLRPVRNSVLNWNACAYREDFRLRLPIAPMSGFNGAKYESQGSEAYGLSLEIRRKLGLVSSYVNFEAANDYLSADSTEHNVKRVMLSPSLSISGNAGFIKYNCLVRGTSRLDSRVEDGFGKPFFSPAVEVAWSISGIPIQFNASVAKESRMPEPEVQLLPNTRMNLFTTHDTISVINGNTMRGGARCNFGNLGVDYALETRTTNNPYLMKPVYGTSGLYWIFSQQVVDYERTSCHVATLSYSNDRLYSAISGEFAGYVWKRSNSTDSSFNTFSATGEVRVSGRFVKERLLANGCFKLKLRPDVWSINPWLSTVPYTLPWFLSAELNIDFKIKTFKFYTKFENLGNYVISHQAGYYLPGPVAKWGIDWQFGN